MYLTRSPFFNFGSPASSSTPPTSSSSMLLNFTSTHQLPKYMLHIWYTNYVLPLFWQTHQQLLFSSFIQTNSYRWFSWLWEKINHKANATIVKEWCWCCRWAVFKYFIFWCVGVFSLFVGCGWILHWQNINGIVWVCLWVSYFCATYLWVSLYFI